MFRSNSTLKVLIDGTNGYRQVTSVLIGENLYYYAAAFDSNAIILFDEVLNVLYTLALSTGCHGIVSVNDTYIYWGDYNTNTFTKAYLNLTIINSDILPIGAPRNIYYDSSRDLIGAVDDYHILLFDTDLVSVDSVYPVEYVNSMIILWFLHVRGSWKSSIYKCVCTKQSKSWTNRNSLFF